MQTMPRHAGAQVWRRRTPTPGSTQSMQPACQLGSSVRECEGAGGGVTLLRPARRDTRPATSRPHMRMPLAYGSTPRHTPAPENLQPAAGDRLHVLKFAPDGMHPRSPLSTSPSTRMGASRCAYAAGLLPYLDRCERQRGGEARHRAAASRARVLFRDLLCRLSTHLHLLCLCHHTQPAGTLLAEHAQPDDLRRGAC
eukprot:360650-Chlamydomonas_euryale.AAC.4